MAKIKLSLEFVPGKLISLAGAFISLLFIWEGEFVYIFFLVVSGIIGGYFFTLPNIYHDETNLYVKNLNEPEKSILLKNITSIDNAPYSLIVKHKDELNGKQTLKSSADYGTERMKQFIALVKKVNSRVEIL